MLIKTGTIKIARVAITANKPPPSESCQPDVGLAKVIIGKNKKNAFHMVPRLNDQGDEMPKKNAKDPKDVKQQRVSVETYSEYFLGDAKNIKEFVHKVGINAKTSGFEKLMDKPKMEKPREDGILTGPTTETDTPLIIT